MNKFYNYLIFAIFYLWGGQVCAQGNFTERLRVGDTVPEVFFNRLEQYDYQGTRPASLKGKLLLLDFWTSSCSSCIAAMPRLEDLQGQFKDDLQIILVNTRESHEEIVLRTRNYPRVKGRGRVSDLPMHNGDSLWRRVFPHQSVPHHVWINTSREVVAITSSLAATPENVRLMLSGKKANAILKEPYSLDGYDVHEQGILQTVHHEVKPDIYHVFGAYDPRLGHGMSTRVDSINGIYRKAYLNRKVLNLYRQASFKREPFPRFSVEISNPERFAPPDDRNELQDWYRRNLYVYEVSLPLHWADRQLPMMIDHLNSYFREKERIEGVFETWNYTTYTVRQTADELYNYSSDAQSASIDSADGFVFKGVKVGSLMHLLRQSIESDKRESPIALFFDWEVDVQDAFDLELPIESLSDIPALKKALTRYGLDIVVEKRLMPVFVLKDYIPPVLR